MKKLKIDLENCYGINKLNEEFDFSDNSTISIYAPNGVMKTSLANTFSDIAKGNPVRERLYNKTPKHEILTDDKVIDKDEILVINSFENKYDSNKSMSTLLVDEDSKYEYDEIFSEILDKKESLINKLNRASGEPRKVIETLILSDFKKKDFIEFISEIDTESLTEEFSELKYSEIFNEDVLSFLKNPEVKRNIENYIEKYNALLENSRYFKKGVFNPAKAESVAKNLAKEKFFEAEHSVRLAGDETEILDSKELNEKLLKERKEILDNDELKKIEKEIKKVSVQRFREILEEHSILPELNDIPTFKIKLWNSYFKKHESDLNLLSESYVIGKERLNEIERTAEAQKTQWDNVVSKFKLRFYVPFKISIQNKSNAILGKNAPNIIFEFKDGETGKCTELNKNELEVNGLLSQGERRAFYLLNVMFNIEARIKENRKTLFIIDDIADSFDYKNKYAIVQYLKDIDNNPIFNQIILTHNFDFFRTIESRNIVKYSNCYYSFKEENRIVLEKAKWIKNPFNGNWKKNLSDNKKLIASIPFIRNLIEYTIGEDDSDYKKLTSILHWKSDTESILNSDLKRIFKNTITNINYPTHIPESSKIVDIIFSEAKNCLSASVGINLENKIVLSIAIRLKAEKYMWSKVTDKTVIGGSQTGKLFERYKTEFNGLMNENIDKLEEVCLMTPENIHLNSFMYEPILDMSDNHLRRLFRDVKALS